MGSRGLGLLILRGIQIIHDTKDPIDNLPDKRWHATQNLETSETDSCFMVTLRREAQHPQNESSQQERICYKGNSVPKRECTPGYKMDQGIELVSKISCFVIPCINLEVPCEDLQRIQSDLYHESIVGVTDTFDCEWECHDIENNFPFIHEFVCIIETLERLSDWEDAHEQTIDTYQGANRGHSPALEYTPRKNNHTAMRNMFWYLPEI